MEAIEQSCTCESLRIKGSCPTCLLRLYCTCKKYVLDEGEPGRSLRVRNIRRVWAGISALLAPWAARQVGTSRQALPDLLEYFSMGAACGTHLPIIHSARPHLSLFRPQPGFWLRRCAPKSKANFSVAKKGTSLPSPLVSRFSIDPSAPRSKQYLHHFLPFTACVIPVDWISNHGRHHGSA